MNAVLNHEPTIRLTVFFGVLAVMTAWEIAAPRRPLTVSKAGRWASNLGVVVLNTVLLRVLLPFTAVALAATATERGWGVVNQVSMPDALEVLLAVIVMDAAIWLQHVVFHAVPVLWRLHRVHHADLDYDVTTGARFHPIEIGLSMLIKFAVILVLGPAPTAVVLFEVLLNAMAMFNHGNVGLPTAVDRALRTLLVTPDMHRVHHSVDVVETNRNFGFNLSVWDRLFGTYKAEPDAGQLGMTIGVPDFRDEAQVERLPGMLGMPFR